MSNVIERNQEDQNNVINVSQWSNSFILELINYVAENSLLDIMPEKSKNTPNKSPEKEEKEDGTDNNTNETNEPGVKVKEKPKKMSHKDLELLVENLEDIPSEQMWNPQQLARVRNDEEVAVNMAVAIHPDFHQSDSEAGPETDSESIASDPDVMDKLLVVSPPGKHPKKIRGKLDTTNYLKRNVSVVTMKKKAVFNAVKASAAKGPKYKCEVEGCKFTCNLKKEIMSHMKGCHDGVHYDFTKEGPKTRVCIAEVAGAVKPKFLIDKNNKLKGWIGANATLIKMNVDKERTPMAKRPVVQTQTVTRKSASQPTQTQTQSQTQSQTLSQIASIDWQAPIGNRNGTPIPPGILGNNPTPKRKVMTRYNSEANDSIMLAKSGKKDRVDDEKDEVQSDNLSDLSSLTMNRSPNESINLLEGVQTSTMRPGEAQRLLNYSDDEAEDTLTRTQTQSQTQSQEVMRAAAGDIDMIEKDQMSAKIKKLEEEVAIVQSRNDTLEEENIGLTYYKMRAKEWLEDRDKMIALLKSKQVVPDELSSQVQSQSDEMKLESVGTQTDIDEKEMKRMMWMDSEEEGRIKEVVNIKKKLERSETMNLKYLNKAKELQVENVRLEKSRDDYQKRCSQDHEVILSLTSSSRSLEMINKDQTNKIKNLTRRIPCKKMDCKNEKECGMSHEFKMAMLAPNKKILCSFFMRGQCNRGDRCRKSHELAKHPLEKVRDRVVEMQNGNPSMSPSDGEVIEEAADTDHPVDGEEVMDQDGTAEMANGEAVGGEVDISLEEISQNPLPPSPEVYQAKGVNTGTRPKVRSRGRGRKERPSSEEVRRMQCGRGFGRGFDHAKALKTQEKCVQNTKNRGRSRERGVSPSPRKGRRSRGSSSGQSFVSAKSSLSRNNSINRSDEKRPASMEPSRRGRVAPPRPRSYDRPRSEGRRIPRPPPRGPPSDKEIGRWYKEEIRKEEERIRREEESNWDGRSNVPGNIVSREDLTAMSDEGLRYIQDRLIDFSQSGNANGQRIPSSSAPNRFRGNHEELRERAVDRYNTRTSNRIHSGEVYNMAAERMRERMERSLFGRR